MHGTCLIIIHDPSMRLPSIAYTSFGFPVLINGSINIYVCLEAHTVPHRVLPHGTRCAWLWNAYRHMAEQNGKGRHQNSKDVVTNLPLKLATSGN